MPNFANNSADSAPKIPVASGATYTGPKSTSNNLPQRSADGPILPNGGSGGSSASGPANPLDRMKMMYGGRAPPSRAEALKNQLKQRRFFDSGDYALSKAGSAKPSDVEVLEIGSEHPRPERMVHPKPERRPSTLSPVVSNEPAAQPSTQQNQQLGSCLGPNR